MKKRWIALLLCALLLCGCGEAEQTAEPAATQEERPAPSAAAVVPTPETHPSPPVLTIEPGDGELVRVQDYVPGILTELRYAGEDNFTGTALYPFHDAWLRYGTVKKLVAAQESLRAQGYGLLIWDAFRPQEVQFRLWEICPDPVYVANPYTGHSSHSNGGTVDITLVTLEGEPVKMPSGFDEFSPLADRDYSDVSPEAAEHAQILERAMLDAGFVPYQGEWWHYSDADAYPYEDLEEISLPADGQSRYSPFGERQLELRTAPDLHAPVLDRIPQGESLPILGFAGDFVRVEYHGQQGYVPLSGLR